MHLKIFNDSCGLDFFISPEQNQHLHENAMMSPSIQSKDINYVVTANNWIQNGSTRSTCYPICQGGFQFTLSDLYGRYGGAGGKPAGVSDRLAYGFAHIDVCQQSPVIIRYQCDAPFRIGPIDGTRVITCLACSKVLGHGRVYVVGSVKPGHDEPEKFRISTRAVFTF